MRRLHSSLDSERGAVLVLLAFTMLLLLGAAALAIDLAAVRHDLRAAQLASDAAATAGAIQIDAVSGSDAEEACLVAWAYLLANIEDEGPTTSPPNCANFSGSCPITARSEPASAGPYSFEITHPVPNNDALMSGQPFNADIDGAPCQRLGVSVERTRDFTFGRVIGFVAGTPEADSVARIAVRPGEGELVPLLLLEPFACDALMASGQGAVTVSFFEDVPGIIAVDSDGSKTSNPNTCGAPNRYTIDANNNSLNWIRAIPTPDGIPSVILSYALSGAPGANPAKSYEEADVTSPGDATSDAPETWRRLYPRPTSTERRITRAPIDWRYNCKPSYLPYLGVIEVPGCGSGDPAHIDNLRFQYGGVASPSGLWNRWTDFYPCTVDKDTWPSDVIDASGNWWVDCATFVVNGGQDTSPPDPTNPPRKVFFNDGDVVFQGGVDLRSFGELHINPSPSNDHIVYLRSGDIIKGAQTTFTMTQTFVYMESGRVNLGGGAGADSLIWTAPLGGDFEDLALWAEAELVFQIGGQAGNTLEGTFFTPRADPFTFTGQGGQFQTAAQFITRRLEVKGQGELRMTPDPDRSTRLPIRGVMLIR
jgi:hypothetical protein